jgi:ATP-binding cassette subfamily C protein LapB
MKPFFKKRQHYLTDRKLRAQFCQESLYLNALLPLLSALNFKGREEDLLEAAPYLSTYLDLSGLMVMMEKLGFESFSHKVNLKNVDERLLPALFVGENGGVYVLLKKESEGLRVYSANEKKMVQMDDEKTHCSGKLYGFSLSKSGPSEGVGNSSGKGSWTRQLIGKYRGLLLQVLFLTFIQSLIFLAIPMYVMGVYSSVIGSGSYLIWGELLIGILLSVALLCILQAIRYRVLAYVGTQLDRQIGTAIVEKFIQLPSMYTSHIPLSGALSQIKNFDAVREFFSGDSMISLIEAPFLLIFLVALAILGKWLVFIPILMGILLFFLTWLIRSFVFYRVEKVASTHHDLQEFTLETVSYFRLIKLCGGLKVWFSRYLQKASEKAVANYQSGVIQQIISAMSDAVMMMSGLMILAFGVLSVWSGVIPVSALLGVMILTWRVLGPLKALLLIFVQSGPLKAGIRQLDNLLNLPNESQGLSVHESLSAEDENFLRGTLSFNNVTLRFPNKKENALSNLSFEIKPGSIVGITGLSGSGKSSLLKLVLNLYSPSFGEIYLNQKNISQFPVSLLRKNIAYVSQRPEFFYGTIRQNLALRNPLITEAEMNAALKQVGLLEAVLELPEGLDTQIRDQKSHWPKAFFQCLAVARALVRPSSMLLLDEVSDGLDPKGDEDFQNLIISLRGKVTVLMVTQRPSHLKLTDEILFLRQGCLQGRGPSHEILKNIMASYEHEKK